MEPAFRDINELFRLTYRAYYEFNQRLLHSEFAGSDMLFYEGRFSAFYEALKILKLEDSFHRYCDRNGLY